VDAVILAAGLGTRLRPYTNATPKPLLAIRGRPILDWTLGALPPVVDRVVVVVNYLADLIEDFLHTQEHVKRWDVVYQTEPKGTGDAVRSCRSKIHSDRFLVLNGDDLYGAADLALLAEAPAGLLVHPVDHPRDFGIVFLRPDGTLERLEEKPNISGTHLANTGAYLLPKVVFDTDLTLSARDEYEITQYVANLAPFEKVHAVRARFWLPIGTVEAWRRAESLELDRYLSSSRSEERSPT
jgi:bifunctional UDP-N-acetylglucosamine pyrophosphorylase/glucosamine-1-phosphate N-acetyltransferase